MGIRESSAYGTEYSGDDENPQAWVIGVDKSEVNYRLPDRKQPDSPELKKMRGQRDGAIMLLEAILKDTNPAWSNNPELLNAIKRLKD